MRSRGEASFVKMPAFGARLYHALMRGKALDAHYVEIARDLLAHGTSGRILDVGTGPGRLLAEIHKLDPAAALHGLDVSDAMVRLARQKLRDVPVDLRCGSIRRTSYESGFFGAVTCSGSLYLWDHPEECLREIFRILKEGRQACLYESARDFDRGAFEEAMRRNLASENLVHRLVGPYFMRKQLAMTYTTAEIEQIIARTPFKADHSIERITLAGLPVWLRISLTKAS